MKVIRPHDRCWSALFAAEALELKKRLGEAALEIEHIGSTAIPGLMAKPIIDVLVVARALDEVDARASAMKQRGYEPRASTAFPDGDISKRRPTSRALGFTCMSLPAVRRTLGDM